MKKLIITALCIAIGAFLAAGCGSGGSGSGNLFENTGAKALPENEVVAWVNDVPIPKKQVDEFIAMQPAQRQAQFQSPQGMKMLVEQLVDVELLFQKAKADGFLDDKDAMMLIQQTTKQVVASYYVQKKAKEAGDPDEAKAREFYDENPNLFKKPPEIRPANIMFKIADDGSDDAAKRAECEKVLAMAQKEGADFGALAKKYSDSDSKEKGGDMGFVDARSMDRTIGQALFAAKDGEVKGCIKAQGGYQIVKKVESREGQAMPFDEAKDRIIENLKRQGPMLLSKELTEEAKAGATIKYNDALMPESEQGQPSVSDILGAQPAQPGAGQ